MIPDNLAAIGRYKVIRALGEGGMGAVFLARDPAIDRLVAIKLMRGRQDNSQLRERFSREAKAIGRLHHPNIVTIFDVGEHDGEPFIAMEYVEGQTLANLVGRTPDLPLPRKLGIMDGLCAGLHYAHKHGIVHRDIKPANVMIDAEGRVKILDFGIARSTASGLTQTGTLIGTLNYMSPEQLMGQSVDQRSDIFAVGAVFYEALSGKPAFPGEFREGLFHRILNDAPAPLRQACPGLDPRVVVIVDRCLEKDPARRYPDLEAMRADLAVLRGGRDEDRGVAPVPAGGRPGAVRRPPSEDVLRQREALIEQHLARAREALSKSDSTAVLSACRDALILDPSNADAAALQDRAEALLQARECVKEAQGHLERGALTAASLLVQRALELEPTLPEALEARDAVQNARRVLEERERRVRALDDAMARARAHLSAGALDLALPAVEEAEGLDEAAVNASGLRAQLDAAFEARAREAEDNRAKDAVAKAQRQFAAGQHEAALGGLAAFLPSHPLVTDTYAVLDLEWRAIERRRREDAEREAARLREESARQREETARQRDASARPAAGYDPQFEETMRLEDSRRRAETRSVTPASTVAASPPAADTSAAPAPSAQASLTPPPMAETVTRLEPPPTPMPLTMLSTPTATTAPSTIAPVSRRLPVGVWIAAGVAVIAAVAIWLWPRSESVTTPVAPMSATAVAFDIRPWAQIERVTARSGAAVNVQCPATPCIVPLAPGEYHVVARNPFLKSPLEFDLVVPQAAYFAVSRPMPDLAPDAEARRMLEGR
jgi:eukaryotic-like serine/threonine-protein kinase